MSNVNQAYFPKSGGEGRKIDRFLTYTKGYYYTSFSSTFRRVLTPVLTQRFTEVKMNGEKKGLKVTKNLYTGGCMYVVGRKGRRLSGRETGEEESGMSRDQQRAGSRVV